MVLGMTFFFNQLTFSNFYLDFYFPFSLWTSISLFSLDFYFPFFFGLLFLFPFWTFIFPFIFGLLFHHNHILDFFQKWFFQKSVSLKILRFWFIRFSAIYMIFYDETTKKILIKSCSSKVAKSWPKQILFHALNGNWINV